MYTCTQNRTLHHEDCPARSLYPWREMVEKNYFNLEIPSCWKVKVITVLWLRLNFTFINQSNGVLWRIYDFWRHSGETKNILYFWESLICLQSKNRLKCFIKPIKLYFTSLTETLHTCKVRISRSPINAGLFRPTDKGHITNKICLILSIFIYQTRQRTKCLTDGTHLMSFASLLIASEQQTHFRSSPLLLF